MMGMIHCQTFGVDEDDAYDSQCAALGQDESAESLPGEIMPQVNQVQLSEQNRSII